MRKVAIGKAMVTGVCIGGNPFSGFSHQGRERDKEMTDFYTLERIKATLRAAEQTGINTFFGRTDDHIMGIVNDYWKEGGTIQWFAQVRTDSNQPDSWKDWLRQSLKLGAAGMYMHGGEVDFWYANGQLQNLRDAFQMMRAGGVKAAGFAGHKPEAHEWIRDNLDVDFQMCSHYDPTDRSQHAHHIAVGEKWDEEDRRRMLKTIATIRKPVAHYKVFAGGNKPVIPALELLGKVMRPTDVVVMGFYVKDEPDLIARNVRLFEKHVDKTQA